MCKLKHLYRALNSYFRAQFYFTINFKSQNICSGREKSLLFY
nr:MAG TPA: hypothetical protein [Bacteriophage sp.]